MTLFSVRCKSTVSTLDILNLHLFDREIYQTYTCSLYTYSLNLTMTINYLFKYKSNDIIQDHLEEIFNKWRLLDDDIWCKLIIMERNRRIGKAYARVPRVTIDGSHELSYDGYKLALNGFDNPDRDSKTEECRKRIGKGIRIKMDNFGNILIKRLSKSGVYIKEWLHVSDSSNSSGAGGSGNGSGGVGGGRLMPSRQQLIKNVGRMGDLGSQIGSSLSASVTPSSSSGGSSMDLPNDSAICDEVIRVGGRLEADKIYVMFDMKKFQANITQELCRPYPDKRKLEQQCFSIVGLACDAEDVLNLPCWVMVINIVAIELLNERFPLMNNHYHTSFPDTMLMNPTSGRRGNNPTPSFVSVFEQNNNERCSRADDINKEEDPYSLPANASSSDVKSSIHDYGTTSTKNISSLMDSNGHHHPMMSSRYYGNSRRADMYAHKRDLSKGHHNDGSMVDQMKYRSKSNCNIYGTGSKVNHSNGERYNNSSSIYSPGHMLVQPNNDSVPPKLPPRDFVKKSKSKSSSNVNNGLLPVSKAPYDPENENIYSTGMVTQTGNENEQAIDNKLRKTKKNRFLESLKAPLELAKSSNRSASVLGTPIHSTSATNATDKKNSGGKSKGVFTKSSAKNLKSFLGVSKGNNKARDTVSDDSNYVHVDGTTRHSSDGGVEVDSVVDSTEDIDDGQHAVTNSSTSVSYNDLDIPTPDYETDENIYAIEEGNYSSRHGLSNSNKNQTASAKMGHDKQRRSSSGVNNNISASSNRANNKEDLYYSGYRAHVPQNIGSSGSVLGISSRSNLSNGKQILEDKMSCIDSRENSRFTGHRMSRLSSSKLGGREIIYGSTTGLPASSMVGSRHRSASMQRYYPRSQLPMKSQTQLYDLDIENPYSMSSSAAAAAASTGMMDLVQGHRRRSNSKISVNPFGGVNGNEVENGHGRVASSVANSNYDIGRSSSGIYGNNSSSSSSDYADWHPHMRKVSSSGYLNSVFKNYIASPVIDSLNTNPLNNNNGNSKAIHGYNNNGKQQPQQFQQQMRNYTSTKTLKMATRPGSTLSKQQQQQQSQQQQQKHQQSQIHQVTPMVDGPTYRSYDSSNGK